MIRRHAFAKINLDLRVLGRRPDGYHELSTVFQSISLHDTIEVGTTPLDVPFSIDCDAPGVPVDERNLVWQAASRLWQAIGRDGPPRGARVRIEKRIPTGAGLGGGSADAAVALVALARCWGTAMSDLALHRLAAAIGADVPFFLMGGTARGLGRGDSLEAWPDGPRLEVVLAFPPFGISTTEAYGWYDADGAEASIVGAPPTAEFQTWLRTCRNDLESPVAGRHRLLSDLTARLTGLGALKAMLSGSGSTVFGLFDSSARADAAADGLRAAGTESRRATMLSRAEFRSGALGCSDRDRLLPGSTIV
jgi:4-diphosphocytidyl-2-C-methyl-D-erythritol kinase